MSQDFNAPVARKGMPLWGKIAIGCGVALMLAIGGCAVGGYFVFKKGMAKVQETMQRPYVDMQAAVKELKTPEGIRAFYEAHPGLVERYPTFEAFQVAANGWKDHLGTLPSSLGSPMELLKNQDLVMKAAKGGEKDSLEIRLRNQEKGWIVGTWKNGQLVDIKAE